MLLATAACTFSAFFILSLMCDAMSWLRSSTIRFWVSASLPPVDISSAWSYGQVCSEMEPRSLESASCCGACSLAAVLAVMDWQKRLTSLILSWKQVAMVQPMEPKQSMHSVQAETRARMVSVSYCSMSLFLRESLRRENLASLKWRRSKKVSEGVLHPSLSSLSSDTYMIIEDLSITRPMLLSTTTPQIASTKRTSFIAIVLLSYPLSNYGYDEWIILISRMQGANHTNTYEIVSKSAGRVLDISQDAGSKGKLILYDSWGGANQQFTLIPSELDVLIRSKASGLYLTVANYSDKNGAPLQEEALNNLPSQKFRLQEIYPGSEEYVIFTFCGKSLDCCENETKNNTRIIQWDFHAKDNQKWKLRKV